MVGLMENLHFLAQQGLDIHKLNRNNSSCQFHSNRHHQIMVNFVGFVWKISTIRRSTTRTTTSTSLFIGIYAFTSRAVLCVDIITTAISTIPLTSCIVVFIVTKIVAFPLRTSTSWRWRTIGIGQSKRT